MQPQQPQDSNQPNTEFGSPTLPPTPPVRTTPASGSPQVFGPAPSPVGQVPLGPVTGGSNLPPQKSKKKGFLKTFLIAIVALLIIGGGSAAAYYGYYLPNTPENQLKAALLNFTQQSQVTAKTTIDVKDSNEGGTSVAIDANISSDSDKGQARVEGTIGVSGFQLPYDVRVVDKDIYVKFSGLEFLSTLTAGTDYASLTSGIQKINDQWYVIDRSFMQQFSSDGCSFDALFNLSADDQGKIAAAYDKHPLFVVKSSSTEKVDGVDMLKVETEPASDQEATNFMNELKGLSIYDQVSKCFPASEGDLEVQADKEIQQVESSGKFYFYISGDKQIKKVSVSGTENNTHFNAEATVSYQADPIEKPEGARPAQEILGDILGGALGDTADPQALQLLTQ